MASISLRGISKSWGDTQVLHPIHLEISSGHFCVLLGPSGCGKSTTLRIIAGLESASSGQVWVNGADVTDLPPAKRGLAMVFQNYALFPHLSVADNITFGLVVRRVDKAERARRLEQAAELLGLSALLDRKPGQLSGGQQQRVALGRALVAQARICLMDEPLSNLDAQLRQEMRHELRELQRRLGLTLVYVTHDQAEAMSMADQVVLLHKGRVEQSAPPAEIYLHPATQVAARFIGTPPMSLLALEDGVVADRAVGMCPPLGSASLGLRPECVSLHMGTVPVGDGIKAVARVESCEYLGADLLLRCRLGSQLLTARVQGQNSVAAGQDVTLAWARESMHFFDARGRRMESASMPLQQVA